MKPEQELALLLQYDPPYDWRGGALQLIQSKAREVVLSGPSETGKTFAACYKAHMAAREYPGAQGALVRKVAASISGTVLLTMKRVIGSFPVNYYGGDKDPERIIYPNGSQIWVGGMDNPAKVLSGERDFIQVCQAEELALNDWEIMTTRTTGRGAVMPYTQVFGDCNPAGSKHWLKHRDVITLIPSVHRDNPTLYDIAGSLTDQGRRTMATLEALTGVRRKRLFEGIWATAEGAVYDGFDAAIHVRDVDTLAYPYAFLAIDEGYTNPAVILIVLGDNDGRLHIFKEFYQRGVLQSEVVELAVKWAKDAGTRQAVVDAAAAGLVAELQSMGLQAEGHKGRVLDRIALVQNMLKVAGDGRPRLTVAPGCINTINEFESYIWKKDRDEPVKENDHAMDALGYLVHWLHGSEEETVTRELVYRPVGLGSW